MLSKLSDQEVTTSPHLCLWKYVQYDLKQFVLVMLITGLFGGFAGNTSIGLIVGLVIFIALHIRILVLVNQWLIHKSEQLPPNIQGIWGAFVCNIYRAQCQERLVHTDLLSLIERARASLKALTEAVVLTNEHHQIEWWNPAAEHLLGIQEENRGKSLLQILDTPKFIDYFHHMEQQPDGIKLPSTLHENQYVQVKLTRFGVESRLLLAHDVTRIHNLEQIRKDFVDNISHELRTPLTVLSGYLETFTDQEDFNPRWKRAFDQMQSQTRRMNALVNDLLLLSRLENDKKIAKNQIVDMPSLMNQLFDDAQAYNTEYGHMLHLEIDSHCDLIGSDMELASAFGNLITNAIKYTPKGGGVITIGWHDDGEHGYFTVQDNGIGIDPQHLPRLTERFYRVDTARSRQTGGTGLGLAIVKHVLMQHGAYLDVQSKVNEGTCFKVIFPKDRLYQTENC